MVGTDRKTGKDMAVKSIEKGASPLPLPSPSPAGRARARDGRRLRQRHASAAALPAGQLADPEQDKASLVNEIQILRQMKHPNTMDLFGVCAARSLVPAVSALRPAALAIARGPSRPA